MGLPPTQGHNNLRLPNTTNMYYNHRLDNIQQHNSCNNQHHFFYHYYYQNHHHHNQLLQLKQQQHQSQQIHSFHKYSNQYESDSKRMCNNNKEKDYYPHHLRNNAEQSARSDDREILKTNQNLHANNYRNYNYYEISTDHFGAYNSSSANRSYRLEDHSPSTSSKPNLKKSFLYYCRCLNYSSIFNNECHSKPNLWHSNYRCTYRKYVNVCGNFKDIFCRECLLGKHKRAPFHKDVYI